MRDKINPRSIAVVAGLLVEGWALYVVGAAPQRWRPALIVQDEPAARTLHKAMRRAIHDAHSLSYTSVCGTPDGRSSAYRVWLKKPNSFHIEQTNPPSQKSATLLDDGKTLWAHWAGDRPTLLIDTDKSWKDERSDVYIKKATLAASGSIRDEIALFGTALAGLILDPGIFHKNADPLEDYLDGIRSRGVNPVRGEECDVIEVSFMQARRTRYLWLSRQDHLPRRVKEIDWDAHIHVTVEEWSNVAVNAEIPPKVLAWSPPQGWQQWGPPRRAEALLQSGQEAPDFELRSARRGKVKLSDYRGQVVWLYLWDSGSPQCREEIAGLQQLHQDYKDKGLAILGFNCTDQRRIARAFLRANGVTFPNVLDPSETVVRLMRDGYGNRTETVPLNYIIDPQGKVVYGWFGHEHDPEKVLAALKKAGLELAQ